MNTELFFIVTVWINIRAIAGRAAYRTVSHQTVKVGLDVMMAYVKGLSAEYSAEIAPVTTAELFAEYSALVRKARTAQLVQGGVVNTRNGAYNIPEGMTAASMSYKRLACACEAIMSGCKARDKRAELESLHDGARRMAGLLSDMAASN